MEIYMSNPDLRRHIDGNKYLQHAAMKNRRIESLTLIPQWFKIAYYLDRYELMPDDIDIILNKPHGTVLEWITNDSISDKDLRLFLNVFSNCSTLKIILQIHENDIPKDRYNNTINIINTEISYSTDIFTRRSYEVVCFMIEHDPDIGKAIPVLAEKLNKTNRTISVMLNTDYHYSTHEFNTTIEVLNQFKKERK